MGNCYLIGAGKGFDFSYKITSDDYVIAVDGGYEIAKNNNIPVDLIVGDFDSLNYIPIGDNVEILPKEKNDTDMLKAIKIGINKGFINFIIMGGAGGRLAHTVANIQCLKFLADNKAKGLIIGEKENITLLTDDCLEFSENHKGLISIFSINEMAKGVTLNGLKYPLTDYDMKNSFPIGVSNEFTGKKAKISVNDGQILIIFNRF